MPKYIALLRAINVGGHNVKMDALRGHFESLGFTSVETFIARQVTQYMEADLGRQATPYAYGVRGLATAFITGACSRAVPQHATRLT